MINCISIIKGLRKAILLRCHIIHHLNGLLGQQLSIWWEPATNVIIFLVPSNETTLCQYPSDCSKSRTYALTGSFQGYSRIALGRPVFWSPIIYECKIFQCETLCAYAPLDAFRTCAVCLVIVTKEQPCRPKDALLHGTR